MHLNDLKHTLANTVQAASGALREAGHVELERRLTFETRSLFHLIGQTPEQAVVRTRSGKLIDLRKPDLSVYGPGELVAEIARALARQTRFAGHAHDWAGGYTVANHSLLVADLLAAIQPELEIWGLLHDAHKVWMGDAIAPVKALCANLLRATEDALDEAVRDHLGLGRLDYFVREKVLAADRMALALEECHFWRIEPTGLDAEWASLVAAAAVYRGDPEIITHNFRSRIERAIAAHNAPAPAAVDGARP